MVEKLLIFDFDLRQPHHSPQLGIAVAKNLESATSTVLWAKGHSPKVQPHKDT